MMKGIKAILCLFLLIGLSVGTARADGIDGQYIYGRWWFGNSVEYHESYHFKTDKPSWELESVIGDGYKNCKMVHGEIRCFDLVLGEVTPANEKGLFDAVVEVHYKKNKSHTHHFDDIPGTLKIDAERDEYSIEGTQLNRTICLWANQDAFHATRKQLYGEYETITKDGLKYILVSEDAAAEKSALTLWRQAKNSEKEFFHMAVLTYKVDGTSSSEDTVLIAQTSTPIPAAPIQVAKKSENEAERDANKSEYVIAPISANEPNTPSKVKDDKRPQMQTVMALGAFAGSAGIVTVVVLLAKRKAM